MEFPEGYLCDTCELKSLPVDRAYRAAKIMESAIDAWFNYNPHIPLHERLYDELRDEEVSDGERERLEACSAEHSSGRCPVRIKIPEGLIIKPGGVK